MAKTTKNSRGGASRQPKRRYTKKGADRYELYQLAVQSAEHAVKLVSRIYRRLRGREPVGLREDFCGTAQLSAEWVKLGEQRWAEGYDLDPEPLSWGRKHNLDPLGAAGSRVVLHQDDVRARSRRRPDVRLAQNFSWWYLKERAELLDYLQRVRRELADDGIFCMDIYGGLEAPEEMVERRKIDAGFTYIWEQERYLPGDAEYRCHISFEFKDGTKLKRAFTYDWRLWTMAEAKDVLRDAGFSEVQSWFEGTDHSTKELSGSGIYYPDAKGRLGRDCAGWLAYLVALK